MNSMRQDQDEQAHLRSLKLTKTIGSATLSARMSPCVWMYPGYPLQVTVTIENTMGDTIISDKATGITYRNATSEAMQALFDQVKICECTKCKAPAFAPDTPGSNRNGLCEQCFLKDWQASYDAHCKEQEAADAKRLEKAKREGFTHRVLAWLHGDEGDDQQIEILYRGAPDPVAIKTKLREMGSVLLDDFKVVEL